MLIYNVTDEEFAQYGKVLSSSFDDVLSYLAKTPMPKENNLYVRNEDAMTSLPSVEKLKETIFGLGDIEAGYCNGYNEKLNCLEFHACPEVDIPSEDIILMLARPSDIYNGVVDSKDVKAFYIKKGQGVLLYPYTLHFSPCKVNEEGFHCAIILSDKTNMDLDREVEDRTLWKVNKWLFAHKEAKQAELGAYIGIVGKNLSVHDL